jgi:hypothetical protein
MNVTVNFRTNGTTFRTKLVTSDLKKKIKINDVVTYKFKIVQTAGKPILPEIFQIRRDITWKDALLNRSKIINETGETSFCNVIHAY